MLSFVGCCDDLRCSAPMRSYTSVYVWFSGNSAPTVCGEPAYIGRTHVRANRVWNAIQRTHMRAVHIDNSPYSSQLNRLNYTLYLSCSKLKGPINKRNHKPLWH